MFSLGSRGSRERGGEFTAFRACWPSCLFSHALFVLTVEGAFGLFLGREDGGEGLRFSGGRRRGLEW